MNANYQAMTEKEINEHFIYSALEFDFQKMTYLLTSKDLPFNAQIDYQDCVLIRRLISIGSINDTMESAFPLLDFLFNSPVLTKHADIHYNQDWLIVFSSVNKNLQLMQYLLSSPTLNEHANVHTNNDIVFRNTCSDRNMEMIHYLVFDYGITLTPTIQNDIQYEKHDIYALFEKRELEKQLQTSLIDKQTMKTVKL